MSLIDTVNYMAEIDAKRDPMERCAGRVQWEAIRLTILHVGELDAKLAELRVLNREAADNLERVIHERDGAAELRGVLFASETAGADEQKP